MKEFTGSATHLAFALHTHPPFPAFAQAWQAGARFWSLLCGPAEITAPLWDLASLLCISESWLWGSADGAWRGELEGMAYYRRVG